MNFILKLEDAAKFVAAYALNIYFGNAWWFFFAWLLAPDVSAVGYLINTRVGAIFYNIAHHQGLAIVVFATGFFMSNSTLIFAGIVLFGHSAMDRMLGYGLKYPDNFKHTHLGWIGKK